MGGWHCGVESTMPQHSRLLALLWANVLCLCTQGLSRGKYGGQHWEMEVNSDFQTGRIEGDCSVGTIANIAQGPYSSGVGTPVNFSVRLQLQFKSDNSYKTVNVTDGLLGTDNTTLTGTFRTGTYTERFKVQHLMSADIFKCISGVSRSSGVGLISALLVAVVLSWQ